MTDTVQTPGQQTQVPGQQVTTTQTTPPSGYVEQARFNGLVQKVEELTLSNRTLNEQLVAKSSELEQLKGQLSIKDAEKTVAVGERDKRLQDALTSNQSLQTELAELRGLKLKIEVARELGRPELMKIVDRLPNLTDKEALKVVMQDFASFADDMVKARETQLLAGYTPPMGGGGPPISAPGSTSAWEQKVNNLPLGSKERAQALNDYGDWLEKQHTP